MKFSGMVSAEVNNLFLSMSEPKKAAVCGLSGPSGGSDRGRRVQGEGDEHDTDDEGVTRQAKTGLIHARR